MAKSVGGRLFRAFGPAPDAFETDDQKFKADRLKLWNQWSEHPWAWLTGTDLDGKPLIWTTDERDEKEPAKPFPAYKEYLKTYIDLLQTENVVMANKPRQMYLSYATLLWMDWLCRFRPARRCVLSKVTEEQAQEMLRDKVRATHTRLPEWVKEWSPLASKPAGRLPYTGSGSYILAANQEMAEGQARGGTASVLAIDEAAYQDKLEDMLAASWPNCDKIILLTTANVGAPGAVVFKMLMEEGRR